MPKQRLEARANTVSGFVKLFQGGGVFHGSGLTWYRGETRAKSEGTLLPSIARRPSKIKHEWAIYQRFRQSAAAFLPHASLEPWDWMLYMQHYGVHTRLLDWTESALAALYFAVEKPRRDRHDGVVWCLDPLELNELAGYGRILQCAGIDPEMGNYTVESLRSTVEKPDYQPVAIIAQRSFPRLIAQQGVFTVTHRKQIALDLIQAPSLLGRIRIPSQAKRGIREGLASLGINRLAMFPELQSLAEGH